MIVKATLCPAATSSRMCWYVPKNAEIYATKQSDMVSYTNFEETIAFPLPARVPRKLMGQRVMHVNPLHTFVPNTASTMQVKSSRMRTHAECLHEILPRSRDKTLERSTYTRRYSVRLDPMLDSLLDQYFSIPHATYNLQSSDDAEIIARF
jgi:hypothetical protein